MPRVTLANHFGAPVRRRRTHALRTAASNQTRTMSDLYRAALRRERQQGGSMGSRAVGMDHMPDTRDPVPMAPVHHHHPTAYNEAGPSYTQESYGGGMPHAAPVPETTYASPWNAPPASAPYSLGSPNHAPEQAVPGLRASWGPGDGAVSYARAAPMSSGGPNAARGRGRGRGGGGGVASSPRPGSAHAPREPRPNTHATSQPSLTQYERHSLAVKRAAVRSTVPTGPPPKRNRRSEPHSAPVTEAATRPSSKPTATFHTFHFGQAKRVALRHERTYSTGKSNHHNSASSDTYERGALIVIVAEPHQVAGGTLPYLAQHVVQARTTSSVRVWSPVPDANALFGGPWQEDVSRALAPRGSVTIEQLSSRDLEGHDSELAAKILQRAKAHTLGGHSVIVCDDFVDHTTPRAYRALVASTSALLKRGVTLLVRIDPRWPMDTSERVLLNSCDVLMAPWLPRAARRALHAAAFRDATTLTCEEWERRMSDCTSVRHGGAIATANGAPRVACWLRDEMSAHDAMPRVYVCPPLSSTAASERNDTHEGSTSDDDASSSSSSSARSHRDRIHGSQTNDAPTASRKESSASTVLGGNDALADHGGDDHDDESILHAFPVASPGTFDVEVPSCDDGECDG